MNKPNLSKSKKTNLTINKQSKFSTKIFQIILATLFTLIITFTSNNNNVLAITNNQTLLNITQLINLINSNKKINNKTESETDLNNVIERLKDDLEPQQNLHESAELIANKNLLLNSSFEKRLHIASQLLTLNDIRNLQIKTKLPADKLVISENISNSLIAVVKSSIPAITQNDDVALYQSVVDSYNQNDLVSLIQMYMSNNKSKITVCAYSLALLKISNQQPTNKGVDKQLQLLENIKSITPTIDEMSFPTAEFTKNVHANIAELAKLSDKISIGETRNKTTDYLDRVNELNSELTKFLESTICTNTITTLAYYQNDYNTLKNVIKTISDKQLINYINQPVLIDGLIEIKQAETKENKLNNETLKQYNQLIKNATAIVNSQSNDTELANYFEIKNQLKNGALDGKIANQLTSETLSESLTNYYVYNNFPNINEQTLSKISANKDIENYVLAQLAYYKNSCTQADNYQGVDLTPAEITCLVDNQTAIMSDELALKATSYQSTQNQSDGNIIYKKYITKLAFTNNKINDFQAKSNTVLIDNCNTIDCNYLKLKQEHKENKYKNIVKLSQLPTKKLIAFTEENNFNDFLTLISQTYGDTNDCKNNILFAELTPISSPNNDYNLFKCYKEQNKTAKANEILNHHEEDILFTFELLKSMVKDKEIDQAKEIVNRIQKLKKNNLQLLAMSYNIEGDIKFAEFMNKSEKNDTLLSDALNSYLNALSVITTNTTQKEQHDKTSKKDIPVFVKGTIHNDENYLTNVKLFEDTENQTIAILSYAQTASVHDKALGVTHAEYNPIFMSYFEQYDTPNKSNFALVLAEKYFYAKDITKANELLNYYTDRNGDTRMPLTTKSLLLRIFYANSNKLGCTAQSASLFEAIKNSNLLMNIETDGDLDSTNLDAALYSTQLCDNEHNAKNIIPIVLLTVNNNRYNDFTIKTMYKDIKNKPVKTTIKTAITTLNVIEKVENDIIKKHNIQKENNKTKEKNYEPMLDVYYSPQKDHQEFIEDYKSGTIDEMQFDLTYHIARESIVSSTDYTNDILNPQHGNNKEEQNASTLTIEEDNFTDYTKKLYNNTITSLYPSYIDISELLQLLHHIKKLENLPETTLLTKTTLSVASLNILNKINIYNPKGKKNTQEYLKALLETVNLFNELTENKSDAQIVTKQKSIVDDLAKSIIMHYNHLLIIDALQNDKKSATVTIYKDYTTVNKLINKEGDSFVNHNLSDMLKI